MYSRLGDSAKLLVTQMRQFLTGIIAIWEYYLENKLKTSKFSSTHCNEFLAYSAPDISSSPDDTLTGLTRGGGKTGSEVFLGARNTSFNEKRDNRRARLIFAPEPYILPNFSP